MRGLQIPLEGPAFTLPRLVQAGELFHEPKAQASIPARPRALPFTLAVLALATPAAANLPWQCEFQVVGQTETGFKMVWVITPSPGQPGGNFSITGLRARVGLKRGGPKLPAQNRG